MIEFGISNVWMELFECNYDTMKIILHTRDQPNTTGEENGRNRTRRLSPSHGLMTIQSLKQLQTHIFWGCCLQVRGLPDYIPQQFCQSHVTGKPHPIRIEFV